MSSKLDLARPHVFVHDPVAHEAVKRAFETGRFVFLKTKMTYLGAAVATQQTVQEVLRLGSGHEHHQAN